MDVTGCGKFQVCDFAFNYFETMETGIRGIVYLF